MRTYAALGEAEARGETAALFADIRLALGVPVVNLIWRHLATLPGALEWAWTSVRPSYRSGAAAREGAALLAALPLPVVPSWSSGALRTAVGDESGERALRTVLTSYDRSNAMNLVALTALGLRIQAGSASPPIATAPPLGAATEAPVEGQLPAMLSPGEMTPATAELVARLDGLGDRGDPGIPASMYRHLARWPAFLQMAVTLIAPLDGDGRLGPVIADARELARGGAARLLGELDPPGPPPAPATREAVQTALADFTGGVIAKMVPICALLRRALSDPLSAGERVG